MLVKEFMSTEVVTIAEDKNMLEVRELMRSSDKRRLPVVDDISRVRGIITDADVSRTSPTDATTLSRYEANYLLGKLKVRDVMTKNVITVHYDAGVEDAAYLLYKNKINTSNSLYQRVFKQRGELSFSREQNYSACLSYARNSRHTDDLYRAKIL